MTLSEYSKLKDLVVTSVGRKDNQSNVLQSLKNMFKKEINSVRRFEQITSIGQLLKVMELRDYLSENNVDPLKKIACRIQSNELLKHINNFEESYQPRVNYYSSEASNNIKPEDISHVNPFDLCGISKNKKERMFLTVIERIGGSWRDLARNLKIRECEIDKIEYNYDTLYTKALKMMEHFQSRSNPQTWFFVLCDALDNIHRKEITRSLKELMTMNI